MTPLTEVFDKVSTRLLCEMLFVQLSKLKQRLESSSLLMQQVSAEEHEVFMVLLAVVYRDYSQATRDDKIAVIQTWFNDIVVFTRRFPVPSQAIIHVLHYRLSDAPREFEFVSSPIIEQECIENTLGNVD